MKKILLIGVTVIFGTITMSADDRTGEALYKASCASCHNSGTVGETIGAPTLRNIKAWKKVKQKGIKKIYDYVLKGKGTANLCMGEIITSKMSNSEATKTIDYMLLTANKNSGIENKQQLEDSKIKKGKEDLVSLDGLKLGMSKKEVFKLKFPQKPPKSLNLGYIEKLYYRETGKNLEKDFYLYKTKIADEEAYIWLWFTKDTSKLYAMRVEWRDLPEIAKMSSEVHDIFVKKYGDPGSTDNAVWDFGNVKIIEKYSRISIDATYFRNILVYTYIDKALKKQYDESIVPYQRPSTGL
jgi:cytochrome c5